MNLNENSFLSRMKAEEEESILYRNLTSRQKALLQLSAIDKARPLYSLNLGEFVEVFELLASQLIDSKPEKPESNESKFPNYMNIHQASEFTQLAVPTLYSMNSRKQIPFVKKSGKIMYSRESLEKWLASGENKTKEQLRSIARKEVENGNY